MCTWGPSSFIKCTESACLEGIQSGRCSTNDGLPLHPISIYARQFKAKGINARSEQWTSAADERQGGSADEATKGLLLAKGYFECLSRISSPAQLWWLS